MKLLHSFQIAQISGASDLNLEWNDNQIHGQVGGGHGQYPNGINYNEVHGTINVNPNIEFNGQMTLTDQGSGYYVGGNWNF